VPRAALRADAVISGAVGSHPTGLFWEASAAARPRRRRGRHDDGLALPARFRRVFAACDHRSGDLIVKLPRHRVQQLTAIGAGKPFAPAGKTFREWVVIGDRDQARWATLIDEARTYASRAPSPDNAH
jgi:hypothetical protein